MYQEVQTLKRFRIGDLGSDGPQHVAAGIVPGKRISGGALSFHTPGMRTHDDGPHVHADQEVFCILQGRGVLEIDGRKEPITAGDVLVIEPGEDHHIVGDPAHPIVNLWFHASDTGNPKQYPGS